MELIKSFRKSTMVENEYLIFDNYPFKLAIIQPLMYDLNLLGEKYQGGDEYFKTFPDYLTASKEESIRRLASFIERGNHFFQELNIPCSLADRITELYVGEELDVYYHINPQWLDWDDVYEEGKVFTITDISEREFRQFPNLELAFFNMYHQPPQELVKKLKDWGITVIVQ